MHVASSVLFCFWVLHVLLCETHRLEAGSFKQRRGVLKYIQQKRRRDPSYSVIDVGPGEQNNPRQNWSWGVAQFFLDVQPIPSDYQGFQMDVQLESDWSQVLQHVAKHGKFNFSICSHVIEDLQNPRPLLRHLRDIAHEGFIAVPSKFLELQRNVDLISGVLAHGGSWSSPRGFRHHKWIFTSIDGRLFGLPKDALVEADPFFDKVAAAPLAQHFNEIRWMWPPFRRVALVTDFGGTAHRVGVYRDLLTCDDLSSYVFGDQDTGEIVSMHEYGLGSAHLIASWRKRWRSFHVPIQHICDVRDSSSCWSADLNCSRCCRTSDRRPHGDPHCWPEGYGANFFVFEHCCHGFGRPLHDVVQHMSDQQHLGL